MCTADERERHVQRIWTWQCVCQPCLTVRLWAPAAQVLLYHVLGVPVPSSALKIRQVGQLKGCTQGDCRHDPPTFKVLASGNSYRHHAESCTPARLPRNDCPHPGTPPPKTSTPL